MYQRSVAKTSDAVSVGLASTTVVAENRSRVEITVVNDGANIIYLALQTVEGVQPTAVANKGIRLAAGASWTSQRFVGAISAIALVGATNLTVAEL